MLRGRNIYSYVHIHTIIIELPQYIKRAVETKYVDLEQYLEERGYHESTLTLIYFYYFWKNNQNMFEHDSFKQQIVYYFVNGSY